MVLVEKTGTLTLGRLQLTDAVAAGGFSAAEVPALAVSTERFSEHPLAQVTAARREVVPLAEP